MRSRRKLVEHLLRKHELILTMVVSGHDRFAALKNLERAEKRFLLAFLTNLAGGSYWLSMELWGLDVKSLLALPVNCVVSIVFATALVVTSVLAILAYLSVGLVVQRAVEIKPRDDRG